MTQQKTGGWLFNKRLPIGFDSEEALMEYLEDCSLSENEQTMKCLGEDIEILQYHRGLLERVVEKQKRKGAKKKK